MITRSLAEGLTRASERTEVVGRIDSGLALVAAVEEEAARQSHVDILDAVLNGIDAVRRLRKQATIPKVVILRTTLIRRCSKPFAPGLPPM